MSEGTHPLLYLGEVTRRDDPDGLGRVRCLIPGVIEPETRWAFPMGAPGAGTAQRGTFEPPAVGSNVMVQFLLGDPDHPYYQTGPWGDPGGVSDVPTNAEVEGDDRQNAVTECEEWRVERDSREAEKKLTITHRTTDLEITLEAKSGTDIVTVRTHGGQKIELKGTAQQAILDSGLGPALTLDGAAQTVGLALGSGPKLELFAGGFALSAGSSPEFAGEGGKAYVGVRGSTEALVHGTAYRTNEVAFLAGLLAALNTFAGALGTAIDPIVTAAAGALVTALSPLLTDALATDATAHLSTKAFTE